jgi:hypothetical protein
VVRLARRVKADLSEPTPEEFEKFVAAALKVDPKGLSGKHRKEAESEDAPN